MSTSLAEMSDGIYRISTFVPDIGPTGFTFNQFLVVAEEPLLYHTGMRGLFPAVSEAVGRVVSVDRLRWIAFSHVEADECGAVNHFLAAAPHAQVAHDSLGCAVSLNDMCDRPPRALAAGEVIELGGKEMHARRVRHTATPHVPHNWESQVFFEEVTGTLFCGDIGTQLGPSESVFAGTDLVSAAIEAEQVFRASCLGPAFPATLRSLADLQPTSLAIMHGSSHSGDCATMLRELAAAYEEHFPEVRVAG